MSLKIVDSIMKGFYTIILRDLRRIRGQPMRLMGGMVQPLLYLFLLGSGVGASSVIGRGAYLQHIFPGVVALSLLFTATFAAITIVFDRETGFLKAVLVAPIARRTVALAKVFSGALQAMVQGIILLIFAPVVGIFFQGWDILLFIIFMFLNGLVFSALGVAVATNFTSTEVFPVVLNAVLLPMFFLSGALFPMDSAPDWLRTLAYIDPVAYGVDLMRGAFSGSFYYPFWVSLLVLTAMFASLTWLGIRFFEKGEDD